MPNSGQSPTNQVGPYFKNIDTIPPGEIRQQFVGLVAGANQIVFTNPKTASIEVAEVLFQNVGGVGATVVTLLSNGVAVTPPLELYDGMGYDDSGFILNAGQSVALTIVGGGTVSGFVRWRYQ
jgi:hypothetical protein